MDVHLATALHLECQCASFAFIVEDSRTTVAVGNAIKRSQCLVALLHEDTCTRTILTECDSNGSLRTNKQVNGVAVLKGPAVLCIVPVETVACGVEGFMVLSIEEFVGQVEDILLVSAGHLNLGLDSIKLSIGCDDVSCGKLLAQDVGLEPTTSLVAFLGSSSFVDVIGKCINGGVFLDSLRSQYAAVNTDILQFVVWFEDDVQHVFHLCLASSHRDGNGAGILLLSVCDFAHLAAGSSNVGQRIACANHSLFLRQLQCSFILLAKDVLDSVIVAVDLERCQYGNVLLSAIEDTLDNDVCQTNLFAGLQFVEVELQSASALTGCSTSDIIVLDGVRIRIIAFWLDFLFQFDGCAVSILPVGINQTIVGAEAVGFESNLGRCERKARFRSNDEADSVIVRQVVVMLVCRCQARLLCVNVGLAVLNSPVASDSYLARQEVVGIRELCLLTIGALAKGERSRSRFVVKGSLALRSILKNRNGIVVVVVVFGSNSHETSFGIANLGLISILLGQHVAATNRVL